MLHRVDEEEQQDDRSDVADRPDRRYFLFCPKKLATPWSAHADCYSNAEGPGSNRRAASEKSRWDASLGRSGADPRRSPSVWSETFKKI